jgi:hypothetical protein
MTALINPMFRIKSALFQLCTMPVMTIRAAIATK